MKNNTTAQKLKNWLVSQQHIFLDNDGFLFDNTEKMNDAAIFTLRHVFDVEVSEVKKIDVLYNLENFYSQNSSVFQRVPFVASESLKILRQGVYDIGDVAHISEKDIFRMSSRAYGGAFLPFSPIDLPQAYERFEKLVQEYTPHKSNTNMKKIEELIHILQQNVQEYALNGRTGDISPISGERYVKNGITSRFVFEAYLAIYLLIFEPQVQELVGARELVGALNKFCKKQNKGFGLISNRSQDSLIPLLSRHDFIGETMLSADSIFPADPVLGGKPRLHQFRAAIPAGETILYFGDLPTDVAAIKALNEMDGPNTAKVIVIPSKFEFYLDQQGSGEHNFSPEEQNYTMCIAYPTISEVIAGL